MDAPADVKSAVTRLQSDLRQHIPGASWTRPEGFHITLKFLGEISQEQMDTIKAALSKPTDQTRFEAQFDHTGVFPKPEKARVLWAGLGKGEPEIRALFRETEERAVASGFPRESRSFSGHLTLARFRNPRQIPPDLFLQNILSPSFVVDKITLFRSKLDPRGAIYSPLAVYSLSENRT